MRHLLCYEGYISLKGDKALYSDFIYIIIFGIHSMRFGLNNFDKKLFIDIYLPTAKSVDVVIRCRSQLKLKI